MSFFVPFLLISGFAIGGVVVSLEMESWFFAAPPEMSTAAFTFALLGAGLWLNRKRLNLVPHIVYACLNWGAFFFLIVFYKTFDPRALTTASALSFELIYWALVILTYAILPRVKTCYN